VRVNENHQEIKDKIEFVDLMKFKDLMPGNFFGARMLMPFEHYSSMKRLFYGDTFMQKYIPKGANADAIKKEPDEFYHTKSLLSVVANSAKVTVWLIDNIDMNYLPEKTLKSVFEQIVFQTEEDRPCSEQDIEFIVEQFQKWDRYKVDFVESLFERRYIEKFMQGM
jgi:hypothetical protein